MKRRTAFNTKRQLDADFPQPQREELAARVGYGGNPEHKRNPGDFGLTPPASPRPDKTLCDAVAIFNRAIALGLLRAGVSKGMVSQQKRGDFPQNIWAVTENGCPLEAQLENPETGHYHGYPMPETDPFRTLILDQWRQSR